VVQGAQYEDLRRQAAAAWRPSSTRRAADSTVRHRRCAGEAEPGDHRRLVIEELPDAKPRHLLGISEPDDLFAADRRRRRHFDCVSRASPATPPCTPRGRFNITGARYRRDFGPIDAECDCYTCAHYTRPICITCSSPRRSWSATLCTIHNERFVIRLVDRIRAAIVADEFDELRDDVLGRYYPTPAE
jgi:queuine tRNA-ribosyltransferase